MSFRATTHNFLRLIAAGAAICAAALVVLVISADGDVAQVQADLFDLHPVSVVEHGDFGRVMEESGLQPRRYDYNGNEIKFAVGDSDLEPRALLEIYQKRLNRAGINTEVYLEPIYAAGGLGPATLRGQGALTEERLRGATAMVDGEVVPIVVNDNHIAMASLPSGADLEGAREQASQIWQAERRGDAEDTVQLLSRLSSSGALGDLRFEENIDAFRYLEAFRDAHTGKTTVTATWSDGGFDAKKVSDPRAVDNRLDLDIPPCIGCSRLHRIEALEADEPYVANQFQSPLDAASVSKFYESSLANRGWEKAPSSQIFENIAAHVPELQALEQRHGKTLNFERGGESLTLFISEDRARRQTNILSVVEQSR